MNEAVHQMFQKYKDKCESPQDYKNALKEIIQEISLLGLWRGKFFEKASFYGGTSLRIFYGLNRFSEDLDFSLLVADTNFDWDNYRGYIENELKAYGLFVTTSKKKKQL